MRELSQIIKKILHLDWVIVTRVFALEKTPWNYALKNLHFMVSKLYLNKKKKNKQRKGFKVTSQFWNDFESRSV